MEQNSTITNNLPRILITYLLIFLFLCVIFGIFVYKEIEPLIHPDISQSSLELRKGISSRLGVEDSWRAIYNYLEYEELIPGMTYEEVLSKLDMIGAYSLEVKYPEGMEPGVNIDELPNCWIRLDFANPNIAKEIGVWQLHFDYGILESSGCNYRCFFD